MAGTIPVSNPAGYITQSALAVRDPNGAARGVDGANPLPVTLLAADETLSPPLTGNTSNSILSDGFVPKAGRPIWISLSGEWSGSVVVKRSIDGGATSAPLTIGGQPWAVFESNAMEPVGEESVAGAIWYLDIMLANGTLSYEVRQ
ncbi:hypothetical protein KY084_03310 [Stakelama sp. CBK3Z-3]|uniref:DUF2793 domain-containing protein n=1 Tax=Stakelama flava TaxID=2860338 RepID=A0ABS6XI86_9SPHN|nr:hypothetical protein [Stakelama flava]MBW4329902.1 hypothetical protein [Stakelama flava]